METNKKDWEIPEKIWIDLWRKLHKKFGMVQDDIYKWHFGLTPTPKGIKNFIHKYCVPKKYVDSSRLSLLKEIREEIEHKFYGANDPKIKDILELIQKKEKE